jgi:hypothetical protein
MGHYVLPVSPPSDKNRAIAIRWRDLLRGAGDVAVHAYYNEDETLRVDIFSAVDSPQPGVTTFATLGLSDYRNELADGTNVPTELIAVAASGSDLPARTLATMSFDHATPGIALRPGVVVQGAISRNDPDAPLPHALLTSPFLWDDLQRVEVGDALVFPLLAVPVTNTEWRFAEIHGSEALESLFEDDQIDIFDWGRPPIRS